MALPCKNGCPEYFEGCHKNCARWKQRQAEEAVKRERVKAARKHMQMIYSIDRELLRRERHVYSY